MTSSSLPGRIRRTTSSPSDAPPVRPPSAWRNAWRTWPTRSARTSTTQTRVAGSSSVARELARQLRERGRPRGDAGRDWLRPGGLSRMTDPQAAERDAGLTNSRARRHVRRPARRRMRRAIRSERPTIWRISPSECPTSIVKRPHPCRELRRPQAGAATQPGGPGPRRGGGRARRGGPIRVGEDRQAAADALGRGRSLPSG